MSGQWHHIPALRLVLPFVIGICLALSFNFPIVYPLFAGAACLCIYMLLRFWPAFERTFVLRYIHGIFITLICIAAGCVRTQLTQPAYQSDYFLQLADTNDVIIARVILPAQETATRVRLDVEVVAISKNDKIVSAEGRSIIYVRVDSAEKNNYAYGDIIQLPNTFVAPASPDNPGAFDYAKYLRQQGIYHIAYTNADEIIASTLHEERKMWTYLFAARAYFHRIAVQYLPHENAQTVGEALVIGSRTDIDQDVRQAYADTGTMHILAVSGLHVGILYAVLMFLFSPIAWLQKSQKGKYIQCLIIVAIVWWYAALSGLSASVNRSAVMFTCMALAKLIERPVNTFNILFISMLILAIDDPLCITQVGFQLSYLAVGGIVFFQPYLQKIWRPQNKIVRAVWSMIIVSVAAQFATVPLTLYYFHQFPNYFLLSNMIAIPVSFVVLITGLIFFAVGWWDFAAHYIGYCLDFGLQLLNGSVLYVQHLPFSVRSNVVISFDEMLLWYLVIGIIGIALFTARGKYLMYALACIFLTAGLATIRTIQVRQSSQLSFYTLKDHDVVAWKLGEEARLWTDTPGLEQDDAFLRSLQAPFLLAGMSKPGVVGESASGQGWTFRYPWLLTGERVVFVISPTSVHQLPDFAPEAAFLFISGEPYLNLADLRQRFPNAWLVIGGTPSWRRHNYYKRAGEECGFAVWSLRTDGALCLPLSTFRSE